MCRWHGGTSHVGTAVSSFRNGRSSKYLPSRLLERYNEALADPDLLALRGDVALVDVRVSDLLTRVDTGESHHAWKQAQHIVQQMIRCRHDGENGEAALDELLHEMHDLVDGAVSDSMLWQEIITLLEQRRKLSESEQKRLIAMEQMITSEQAMILISLIVDSIKRHVHDKHALDEITSDIGRVLDGARA